MVDNMSNLAILTATMADAATTPQRAPMVTTATAPFSPYVEREGSPTARAVFQSISAVNLYRHFSAEELRLNDYIQRDMCKPCTRTSKDDFLQPKAKSDQVSVRLPLGSRQPGSIWLSTPTALPELGSELVFFDVGNAPSTRFALHAQPVQEHSEFARLALEKEWKEAQERVIPLPDDDPEVFKLYQQWIYYKRIFSTPSTSSAKADSGAYPVLVKAYLLGQKLLDGNFKDAMIDCIVEKLYTSATFDIKLTSLVYDATPPKSPLRKLLLDIYVWCGDPTWLDEEQLGEFVNAEFAVELSKRQMGYMSGIKPASPAFTGDICAYHEHAGGVCYRQMLGG